MLNKAEKTNPDQSGAPMLALEEANFDAEVLRSRQPVLVVFWAPWSRPCQVLHSVLQELASALAGRAKVVRVNADESLNLSLWYDIQSVPTLLYFVGGNLRLRIVGTATKEAILSRLKSLGLMSEAATVAPGPRGPERQSGKEN